MAYKRKRSSGRRARGGMRKRARFGVRRTTRRGFRRMGTTSSRQGLMPMNFKRTFWLKTILPLATNTNLFWTYETTSLAACPNAAEYTQLFDTYKIRGIKYKFVPKYSEFAGNDATANGTTNRGSTFVSVINDPRSYTQPAGIYNSGTYNAFCELGNVKTHNGQYPFSVYFKPYIDDLMTVGTIRKPCPWLQTSNTAQTMNGFHLFFHDNNFSAVFNNQYDVFVTLYFQARGMK